MTSCVRWVVPFCVSTILYPCLLLAWNSMNLFKACYPSGYVTSEWRHIDVDATSYDASTSIWRHSDVMCQNDVISTSMRRHYVVMTAFWRHLPAGMNWDVHHATWKYADLFSFLNQQLSMKSRQKLLDQFDAGRNKCLPITCIIETGNMVTLFVSHQRHSLSIWEWSSTSLWRHSGVNFWLFLGGVHCTLRCVCRMSLHAWG